ncbi:p53-like transcription factor [Thozetella sp. PMI_491]|nr:p53-like transcription factor [Thozetella sp. PMI_491]
MENASGDKQPQESHDVKELARIGDAHPALLFTECLAPRQRHPELRGAIVTAQLSGTFLQQPQSRQLNETPRHIICYRRNLFHVRGTIILHTNRTRPRDSSTGCVQPSEIRATLSATENINGNEIPLIAVPRTAKDTAVSPAAIEIKVRDAHEPYAFSWTRLQFRSATFKGGRRKEKSTEQHFVIHIRFVAGFSDGSSLLLTEKLSAPIIVRGRSPCNFSTSLVNQDNQDEISPGGQPRDLEIEKSSLDEGLNSLDPPLEIIAPVTGAGTPVPTLIGGGTSPSDGFFFNISNPVFGAAGQNIYHGSFLADDFGILDGAITFPNYLDFGDTGACDDSFLSDSPRRSLVRFPQTPAPILTATLHTTMSTLATDNPCSEPEHCGEDQPTGSSMKANKKSFRYEYIPLSVDDRTPPVQAVYQPHGVHHKVSLLRTFQGNNKRYFGELTD